MLRLALGVAYDGTVYRGWQIQPGQTTIQLVLERVLSRIADCPVSVVCAGRTDAGVHATGQVLHFDTIAVRPPHAWVLGANRYLPRDIRVLWAKPVDLAFHARFSAVARRYRYIIYNHAIRPAILSYAVHWYRHALDIQLMQEGANHLIGSHDFAAFQASGCQAKHARRTMHHVSVYRQGLMLIIDVKANAFLLHMVRNIVGVLIAVGCADQSPEWVRAVLMSRDRRQAGVTCPPNGLYLINVDYPASIQLPSVPEGPFFLND